MQRRIRFWLGVACLVGLNSVSFGQQFGQDRPSAPAPAAVTISPTVAPTATPATAPANLPSFPTSAPTVAAGRAAEPRPAPVAFVAESHEWSIRPEHGEWMICVKSYTGVRSKADAVELATEIRKGRNAAAFLYERGGEERVREEQRQAEFRQAKMKELTPFLAVQADMRARAAKDGIEYVETPAKYRMTKVTVEQQWAVLVGGFKDMATARQGLETVRKWPVPQGTHLMDRAVMSRPGEGGKVISEATYLNPYTNSIVVPNPSIRKNLSQAVAIDPAISKLNEEEPLSVLKCRKGWTLIVKDFSVPMTVQTKDEGSFMAKLFGNAGDPGAVLEATAKQAREMAKALREPGMERAAKDAATRLGLQPRPLDSYVLHLRTGSRVTVGQFDSLDDPAMAETMRLLANMHFQVWDKPQAQGGRMIEERHLFDGITPMPIPRP